MGHFGVCILVLTLFGFYASAQESYQCDFENGMCSFLKNSYNDIGGKNWNLGTGKQNTGDAGPSVDHTLGNENGKYLFVNLTESRLIFVLLETVPLNDTYCLRFFYHMYGADIPTFKVYAESLSDEMALTYFVRTRTQGDQWKEAEVSINPMYSLNNGYKTIFGISNLHYTRTRGSIALDDIELTPGECSENKNEAEALCTFDYYNCGYNTSASTSIQWIWHSQTQAPVGFRTQPMYDHTLRTSFGGYWVTGIYSCDLCSTVSSSVLYSPVYAKPKSSYNCLRFYLWMDGDGSHFDWGMAEEAYVQVHINFPDSNRDKQWIVTKAKNITQHSTWTQVEASVNINEQFQFQFTSMLKGKVEVSIALDDIQLFPGFCQEAGSCDFEDDKCTWSDDSYGYNWIRKSGKSKTNNETGPIKDKTTGSSDGSYVVFNTRGKDAGAQASLLSEFIPPGGAPLCLSFFYQMSGADLGSLKVVWKQSRSTESTLWLLTDDKGAIWRKGTVELKPGLLHSQVVFRGTIGKGKDSFMALDDIRIRKGVKCGLTPPEADPQYKDECDPEKCLHGKCQLIGNIYKCKCDEGFTGKYCDKKIFEIPGFTYLWIVYVALFIVSLLLLIAAACLYCKSKRNKETVSSVI